MADTVITEASLAGEKQRHLPRFAATATYVITIFDRITNNSIKRSRLTKETYKGKKYRPECRYLLFLF